jgi:MoaA/NifB/PqqE/SkfB family radical SAM enzyme
MIEHKIKNYCPAPFRQVCINPLGELSPCCMVNTEGFGKITEDIDKSINDIQSAPAWQEFLQTHKDEKMPEICERSCGRHYPSEYHNHWEWAKQEGWIDKTFDIKRADIAFSNLCNLSCTMCTSTFSSEWIKLQNKQGKITSDVPWNFSIEQVKELASQLSTCELINIKGGEPFFNPRFKVFLKELADRNTDIHLPILTNGTIIDDDALEQLSRFTRKPTFCISLESTQNNLYRFIRGGKYTFDDIKNNIKYIKEKFPKLILKTNYVLGAYNIDNFKLDMENLRAAGITDCNILIIHAPYEQSINVVNLNTRKRWIEIFQKELKDYPDFYKTIIKDGWDKQIIENMTELKFKKPDSLRMVKKSNEYVDLRKNIQNIDLAANSILDLVPNYIENMK